MIFGDLERIAADLYPYRWPISIGLVLVLAAVGFVAIRLGWHQAVLRHKLLAVGIAVPILAVTLLLGNYTLSPLWERSHLEESSPLALAADTGSDAPAPATESEGAPAPVEPASAAEPNFEPRVTHQGELAGADDFHFGEGTALIIETAPGVYTLRFEEFSVRNGPDLFVFLSPSDSGNADGAVNLGELKATDGAFNYELPPGLDPAQFRYALVWCEDFSVLFASAELGPA